MEPWWTETQAGLVGALLGTFCGTVFGGIGGGVGGPLAARGKARSFVLGIFYSGIGVGVVLLAFAIVALVLGQPFHVWLWPLQSGFILAAVMGALLPVIRKAYRDHEERIITAQELRRG